eukprot:TRINITY_DN37959_c0_g1_i2.p1 TRINITY_DN37959_c0_g1~~TRINITY_DN37959_c0_g1_i2.p1  ORF type:complete len:318 (+),score=65.37 TRINITY_DN37959_c0_g1_i2:180-1133(+)
MVALGIASSVAMAVVIEMMDAEDVEPLQRLQFLKAMRLMRLLRSIRMMRSFRTVWRLVQGLISSWNTLMSTLFLLALSLYTFACLGIELITKDAHLANHPDTGQIVSYHFSSLARTLVTLMALVCADSVSPIYTPLIIEQPALIFYFGALVLLIPVALMNLVTAVLVESSMTNAAKDKEMEKYDLQETFLHTIPKILEVFKQFDVDGDGLLTREDALQVPLDVFPKGLMNKSFQTMEDIFGMLDVTGRGYLDQMEFVDGLLELFLQDVPIQTLQLLKLQEVINSKLEEVDLRLKALQAELATKLPEVGSAQVLSSVC